MKLPQDTHEKMMSAYQLFASASISVSSFENVRTILRGIHPEIDKKLEICSKALNTIQKIESGDIISLSAEHLPEGSENQKKRKKAVLFFIASLRDLQSEIKRVDTEIRSTQNSQGQLMSWGRIIKYAKGPFGLITGAAVVIVVFILISFPKGTKKGSVDTPASTGLAKHTIQVIEYNNKDLPLTQLYVGHGADCDAPHYHAINGSVTALDGTKVVDPEGCGFGKVTETNVITVNQ